MDDIRAFVNEGHAILNNLNNFDDFDFENGDDDSDNDEDLVANGMANALVAGGVPVGLEHILNETPASHGDQGGNHPSFPKVARCRGNLTALSQHYNVCPRVPREYSVYKLIRRTAALLRSLSR